MEDLLSAIVGAILEFFLEMTGEFILDLVLRSFGAMLASLLESVPFVTGIGVVLLGLASGAISLHFFPHPLVHPARIHGISLIISPLIAGLVMSIAGRLLQRRGKQTVQIESFGYSFAFAFSMAAIRLLFVR
jgi:hypothetical protein